MISGVALKLRDGRVISLGKPARHSDLFSKLNYEGYKLDHSEQQGFVTSTGEYVTRWQAARIAIRAGQASHTILRRADGELFSEDVW